MADKYEILPPARGALARRDNNSIVASPPRVNPGGMIQSTLTRWEANRHARTLGALAARTRAEGDLFEAQTQAISSYVKRQEAAFRLQELPEVLSNDRARRRVERAEELRRVEHQHEVAEINRQTEIARIEAVLVDAQQALRAQHDFGYTTYELAFKKKNWRIAGMSSSNAGGTARDSAPACCRTRSAEILRTVGRRRRERRCDRRSALRSASPAECERPRHQPHRCSDRTAQGEQMSVIGTRAIARRAAVRDELRARFPALCPDSRSATPVDRSAIVLGRNQHGGGASLRCRSARGWSIAIVLAQPAQENLTGCVTASARTSQMAAASSSLTRMASIRTACIAQ